MRAIVFDDVGSIRLAEVEDPRVQEEDDAVVQVETAAICGSDLHLLHGRIPGVRSGSVIGHEFVGRVVSVGPGVSRFRIGDRVVGSFLIACGRCWFCTRSEFNNCEQQRVLGYGMFTGDLDGAQAEYVRVPNADVNLHAVPSGLPDEQVAFAGDILSTAVYICERAGIRRGDTVAIVGAGPVGLLALMCAKTYEPERVLMVDVAPDRLQLAESLGAVPIHTGKVNPVVEIQRATGDRGADVVIECVGATGAFQTALDAVRAGGTVAVIGVYSELEFEFPLGEIWRRAITVAMGGVANVHRYWDRALDLVQRGAVNPAALVTHTLPLEDGLRGYELFESRQALKVLLKP